AHVGEDIGLSEILAGLQIQVIYRESTGNRVFPFFAPTPPGLGSAGAAARAPLIEIAALSGLALFCQFCHAAGPTSTSPACIEITVLFPVVRFGSSTHRLARPRPLARGSSRSRPQTPAPRVRSFCHGALSPSLRRWPILRLMRRRAYRSYFRLSQWLRC